MSDADLPTVVLWRRGEVERDLADELGLGLGLSRRPSGRTRPIGNGGIGFASCGYALPFCTGREAVHLEERSRGLMEHRRLLMPRGDPLVGAPAASVVRRGDREVHRWHGLAPSPPPATRTC